MADTIKTPEELAKEINEALSGIRDMIKKSATKEEAEALKDDIAKLRNEFPQEEYADKIDSIEQSVKELSNKVKNVSIVGMPNGVTLRDRIKEQLETETWQKHLKNRAEGESPIANIETKDINWGAAGANGTNDVVQNAMPFLVPQYPFEEPFDVRSVFPVGSIDTGSLDYPQELLYTDGMGMLAETGGSSETSITFQMVTENAHRIATFAEVSRRALRNTTWLSAYLANRFMEKFVKLLNTQSLVGDDTGENLNGVYNQATAYAAAGAFTDTIPSGESTLIDAVIAMKSQLYDTANVMANVCMVSPVTHYQLTVQKTTTREYAYEQQLAQVDSMGMWRINGMTLIMSKDIPDGEALIGLVAPTVLELLFNGGLDMSTTQSHASNFIGSIVAFRFEADVLFPVYRPYAWIKGDLATVQDDITAA